jgi:lipopolysaccharide export system protein LptC
MPLSGVVFAGSRFGFAMSNAYGHRPPAADPGRGARAVRPLRRGDPRVQNAATGAMRTKADFERALRHSGRVRMLRRVLPAAGLLVILGIIASFFIANSQWSDVDIAGARIEAGKLVMDNPSLSGTDADKRPFSLRADRAIQDADNPTRITLEGIKAELPLDDVNLARVTAGSGLYDADRKTLTLADTIVVDTDDGLHIRMDNAEIDIDSGRMDTRRNVEVETGRARVTAKAMTVENNGKTIVFENQVRMTIQPYSNAGNPTVRLFGGLRGGAGAIKLEQK